jgi:hypothetical protein
VTVSFALGRLRLEVEGLEHDVGIPRNTGLSMPVMDRR